MFNHIKKELASRYLKDEHDQNYWTDLFRLSLNKMNYGPGDDYHSSGEKGVLDYLIETFKSSEKLVIFDVGANVGGYTNMVLDCLGSKAQVHAFEPSSSTFEMLQKNVNGELVKLNNMGCSDTTQTMSLYSDKNGSSLASVYNRKLDYYGISMEETEQSEFIRIDDYCKKNSIEHIHLLKMDIEGHELFALKGAQEMIDKNNIDFIQFEFGGCNIDSKTYFRDFYSFLHEKYNIYRILQKGLYKIDHYSVYLEIFVTVNYLAIHR